MSLEKFFTHTVKSGVVVLMLSVISGVLQAEMTERNRLIAVINETMADESTRQLAIEAGKERSLLCASCHGASGNSTNTEIPNVAAQNPAYIVEQMYKFADGRRKNFVMQALTRSFTFEDKVNLAIFYTSQDVEQVIYDERLARLGETVYMRSCFRCHGESGKGEEGYARVAGQQLGYVEMTLKRFRDNANNRSDPEDVRRSDLNMEQATARLSDEEIRGLAHYMAQLK